MPCPECGRAYDLDDPKSYDKRPKQEVRRRRALRGLIVIFILLAVAAGLYWTVIPRPISRHQPAMWVWFNKPIGVQRSPFTGPPAYRVTWFFGEPRAVRMYLNTSTNPTQEVAVLTRTSMDKDEFTLRVNGAGLSLNNLIYAFNTLRTDDEVFGIQWARFNPRDRSVGKFESRGTMAEIMAAIIGHYGLQVQPLKLTVESPTVCVFVPEGVDLLDHDAAVAFLKERNDKAALGIFGPEPAHRATPLAKALSRMEYRLQPPAGLPRGAPVISGQLVWVTPEQAEALGYAVQQHLGPITLQRLEWKSARSGWY